MDIANLPDVLLPESTKNANAFCEMGLSSPQSITGSAKTDVALDTSETDQLDTVTVDTSNNQLKMSGNPSKIRNVQVGGAVQLNNISSISGTRVFATVEKNGNTVISISNDVTHDFQRYGIPQKTVSVSNGDVFTLVVQAGAAGSSDSYDVLSDNTYLQLTQV